MSAPEGPLSRSLLGELGGRTSRLMFYALAAISLMALDYRGHYVDQIRQTAALLVEPATLLIEAPVTAVHRLMQDFQSRQQLLDRMAELERRWLIDQARIGVLEDLSAENRELRRLLGAMGRLESEFVAAELMNIDLNPFSHRVLINRGRVDGLSAGQAVIDATGVIGQIDRVQRHSAVVILISDPDHALPVRIQRTLLRTVAYGSGRTDQLRLPDLPMNVDLEPGDLLVTSGLGGHFPPGLPVATVTDIERRPGQAFALATARPLAELAGGRHVLVIEARVPESVP